MSEPDERVAGAGGPPATQRIDSAAEPSTDRSAPTPPLPPRPSGAFLRTADDGPPLPYEAYPPSMPVADDASPEHLSPEEASGAWDDAPRAVRPIGQLGGPETVGFALTGTGSAAPRRSSSFPTAAPGSAGPPPGRIANDDETPEDELPPTLPPRDREDRAEAPTRTAVNDAEKLEIWLLDRMRRGVPRQSEAERLELWLESLDLAATFEQERRRP